MASKKKVYFYVDGKSEKALRDKVDRTSIDTIFVQRSLNGKDVKIEAIAKECANILKATQRFSSVHIFVIDKEKRVDFSADVMEQQLLSEIRKNVSVQFDLVVADIMFENWILSDIENVSNCHNDRVKNTKNSIDFEGKHGSKELDSLWCDDRQDKYSSDKVGNSKKLFKSVRPDVGKTNSVSFDKFLNILAKHKVVFC